MQFFSLSCIFFVSLLPLRRIAIGKVSLGIFAFSVLYYDSFNKFVLFQFLKLTFISAKQCVFHNPICFGFMRVEKKCFFLRLLCALLAVFMMLILLHWFFSAVWQSFASYLLMLDLFRGSQGIPCSYFCLDIWCYTGNRICFISCSVLIWLGI